ncbi:hypothetical protein DSM101010T_31200 [Desulfovibrio subterraneus]|uniref:Uncharacterized protein n=1 Tax=Desulfovibrio subterraneus TaxID=2718620 RepID=A0A7J0BNM6_9BACT|nr:hypothetical protein DSM101010T_31200 [Desulfovibrio subterraneus]
MFEGGGWALVEIVFTCLFSVCVCNIAFEKPVVRLCYSVITSVLYDVLQFVNSYMNDTQETYGFIITAGLLFMVSLLMSFVVFIARWLKLRSEK